jgi:predicted metal-dependent enzyme (double-stranded beta helix superfamily)
VDEIEFRQTFRNLNTLIDQVAGESTKAALKVIAHLISELRESHDQLVQQLEDDE